MSGVDPEKVRQRRSLSAWHRRRLVIACLVWALVSLSCVTYTTITEVIRTAEGEHTVSLTIQLQMDHAVAEARRKHKDFKGKLWEELPTRAPRLGWSVDEDKEADRIVFARTFQSLEDLAGAADKISQLFEFEGKGKPMVQNLQVIMDDSDPLVIKYGFSATVNVPQVETGEDEIVIYDSDGTKLFEWPVDDLRLFEAYKQAGPPGVVVVATLPGVIQEATIHGYPGGEIRPPNQVRFTFDSNSPGTYVLEAVSHLEVQPAPQPSATPEVTDDEPDEPLEDLLGETLTDDESALLRLVFGTSEEEMDAWLKRIFPDPKVRKRHSRAAKAIGDWTQRWLLDKFVDKFGATSLTEQGAALELGYCVRLAALTDPKGNYLFPSLHAALPRIIKLALKASHDSDALRALVTLKTLLVGVDMRAGGAFKK